MMLPSHLLASLLVGLLLARWRPFEARDWALALAFGVVIDLDHLLQMPAYVLRHGMAGLDPVQMLQYGSAWQGFMHTPWALVVVLPAVFVFRSPLPLVFWGLHMVQDFVVARHFVHFGGALEWAIVGVLGALVVLAVQGTRPADVAWFEHARRSFGIAAAVVPAAALAAAPAEPVEPAKT